MTRFLRKMGTSFSRLWTSRKNLNWRNLRPGKIQYAFAYTFALLLANMQSNFFVLEAPVLGIPARTLMYASHMILSVVVMLLWSNRFQTLIRISSAIMVLALFPFLFLPQGIPKTIFACVCWAGLGGCVSAARFGFAFAANNVERLVAAFSAFVATDILYMLMGFGVESAVITKILPILLVTGLVVSLNRYKKDDLVDREDIQAADRRAVYLAMAYMIAFYAIDGFMSHLVDYNYGPGLVLLGLGSVVAIGLFMVIHVLFKKNVWHIWNLIFAFAIIMAVMAVFPPSLGLAAPKHFVMGLTLVGAPTSLYMLGGVQKRFSSVSLLKKCTILLILFLPAMIIGSDVLALLVPETVPMVVLVFVIVLFIGFTLASPITYKYLFSADWMDDFHKPDMPLIRDKVEAADRLESYGLTPREKEVAALLLEANTVRMIAGELKLSQSTVNMHSANLYKKLGINSKAELFRKFGVPEEEKN